MQQNYNEIKSEGGELIVISSDSITATKNTVQDEGLDYLVLSDASLDVIKEYNVVDRGNTRIARPSTFIMDSEGTIVYKFLGNKNSRVSVEDVFTELGKL